MEEQQALRPLLEVLVAAREPLTRAELRDVLYGVHPSLCPPDGSGQVEFERRMQLLDGFITADSRVPQTPPGSAQVATGPATLRLFHKSFTDWVARTMGSSLRTPIAAPPGGHRQLLLWRWYGPKGIRARGAI